MPDNAKKLHTENYLAIIMLDDFCPVNFCPVNGG